MHKRRDILKTLAAAAAVPALSAARTARAQQPPIRQLTIVVAFPAGGATDQVARLLAEGLRGKYAESVIVDNRVGGNGRVGAVAVKNAPADGSIMLFGPAFPMAILVLQDWSGLVAPAKTPRDTVARLNALVAEGVRSPAVAARLVDIGVEADVNSPEEFAGIYRSTWEKHREVVRSTGFTAED